MKILMGRLQKLVWCVKFCINFLEKYDDEIRSLGRHIETSVAIIDSKMDKKCRFEESKLRQHIECLKKERMTLWIILQIIVEGIWLCSMI